MSSKRFILTDLDAIRPLRHTVLRPGYPFETTFFAGDDQPGPLHYAQQENDAIIAIVSLYPAAFEGHSANHCWQLRGMAVTPERQSEGLGTELLVFCQQQAALSERIIWCNAREHAVRFYLNAGFKRRGEIFEIPDVGLHQQMVWFPNTTI